MDVTDIVNIVRRNNNCYDGAFGRDYITAQSTSLTRKAIAGMGAPS
jgi:hypothetical protein